MNYGASTLPIMAMNMDFAHKNQLRRHIIGFLRKIGVIGNLSLQKIEIERTNEFPWPNIF